jgi:hypothetical protein
MLTIFCLGKLGLGDLALGNRFVGASSAILILDKPLFGTLPVRGLTVGWVGWERGIN